MSNSLSDEERMLAAGYVLGDLTSDETARLETLMAEKVDVLKEVQALQASYELIPQSLSIVAPPAHIRETIQAGLSSTPLASQPASTPARLGLKILLGLATLASLLLATDNFRLRSQLAQEVEPERVASILQQPNSRLISLTGNNSAAAGTLLFTPGNWNEVIVSLGDLPPLPPDQIYRMWLELENGEVIYCGEFNTGSDGSVFVRFTPPDTPPAGVKATELFVTVNTTDATPSSLGERIMQGAI